MSKISLDCPFKSYLKNLFNNILIYCRVYPKEYMYIVIERTAPPSVFILFVQGTAMYSSVHIRYKASTQVYTVQCTVHDAICLEVCGEINLPNNSPGNQSEED